jgi:hypothetical protein
MRFVRPLIGLLFGAAGLFFLFAAGVGWQVGQHRDPDGAFSAELTPVHTDGYAVVVPDLAGAVKRHGLAHLLASTELRVSAGSSAPVVLALAPAADVNRFLDGVGRAAITGVGYAVGAQPVSVSTIAGTTVPTLLPREWTVATGWLPWTVQTKTPMSLVVLRADGRPGLTVTFTASLSPPTWALPAGGVLFVSGLLLVLFAVFLVRPVARRRSHGRRERFVVVAPEHQHDEHLAPDSWVIGAYEPDPPAPVVSPYVDTAT